jgi:hypothetical protein
MAENLPLGGLISRNRRRPAFSLGLCNTAFRHWPDHAAASASQVIIIGRPNVGKSTLFNRLVGKKLALVDDQPGVTRDRRFGEATCSGSTSPSSIPPAGKTRIPPACPAGCGRRPSLRSRAPPWRCS